MNTSVALNKRSRCHVRLVTDFLGSFILSTELMAHEEPGSNRGRTSSKAGTAPAPFPTGDGGALADGKHCHVSTHTAQPSAPPRPPQAAALSPAPPPLTGSACAPRPAPRYQIPVEVRGAQGEEGVERLLHSLRHSVISVVLRRLPPQPLVSISLHRGAAALARLAGPPSRPLPRGGKALRGAGEPGS